MGVYIKGMEMPTNKFGRLLLVYPNGEVVVDGDTKYEAIPAADVRPVVLCRDCKHKGWVQEPEHGKSVDYCRLIERCVDKQFFCAAGEKRAES